MDQNRSLTYSLKSDAYAAMILLSLILSSVNSLYTLACSISSLILLFKKEFLIFSLEHKLKCSRTLRTACPKPSVSGICGFPKSLT
jgi:hypothetical protein